VYAATVPVNNSNSNLNTTTTLNPSVNTSKKDSTVLKPIQKVTFRSKPSFSELYIDGSYKGNTPYQWTTDNKSHYFTISNVDYLSKKFHRNYKDQQK